MAYPEEYNEGLKDKIKKRVAARAENARLKKNAKYRADMAQKE